MPKGDSKVDWREQSGVAHDVRRPRMPPSTEWSKSEGDRNRGSFRPSGYPRLFLRAVCNDDGTPVMERTNELLEEILVELRALRQEGQEEGQKEP